MSHDPNRQEEPINIVRERLHIAVENCNNRLLLRNILVLLKELEEEILTNQMPCTLDQLRKRKSSSSQISSSSEETVAKSSRIEKKTGGIVIKCVIDYDYFKKLQEIEEI